MSANSMGRNWKVRVEDILECIARIQEYTMGITFEQFENDKMRVDAVLRNLEVIGEVATRIPAEIQERYPGMGWLEMRGMRNIVAHEYFGVSLPIIWYTIQHDLTPLASDMRRILSEN